MNICYESDIRHIFLTGSLQVGKSTLVNHVLSALPGVTLAGFRTMTSKSPECSVHILGLNQTLDECCPDNCVGIRSRNGQGPIGFPQIFDAVGCDLLLGADAAQLIVMDEIGKMEADAVVFRSHIRKLLDGNTPVIGVVRQEGNTSLQTMIRSHPAVKLITVTQENRDVLREPLVAEIRSLVIRRLGPAGTIVFHKGEGD